MVFSRRNKTVIHSFMRYIPDVDDSGMLIGYTWCDDEGEDD